MRIGTVALECCPRLSEAIRTACAPLAESIRSYPRWIRCKNGLKAEMVQFGAIWCSTVQIGAIWGCGICTNLQSGSGIGANWCKFPDTRCTMYTDGILLQTVAKETKNGERIGIFT